MANYNMGVSLVWRRRFADAEPYFLTAIRGLPESSPFLADSHYNIGLALMNEGRLDEAVRHYRRSLELNPPARHAATHNNLGAVLLPTGVTSPEPRFDSPRPFASSRITHWRERASSSPGG